MGKGHSFTFESSSGGKLNQLITPCAIFPGFNPNSGVNPGGRQYQGLWDTGATGTVITQRVVDELGLQPTGKAHVCHAGGESDVHTYAINIGLPNEVGFCYVNVTVGQLAGFDVLIGMDIITCGDFAITNKGGKTKFSFKVPSSEDIDFCDKPSKAHTQPIKKDAKPGRNDPCSCNSGKKYKHCCGA